VKRKVTLEKILDIAPLDMASLGLTRSTIDRVKFLGEGAMGVAFLLPNGLVLKYTYDLDEGGLALRLLREKRKVRGLPEVFYVGKWHDPKSADEDDDYLIVMERAQKTNKKPIDKRLVDVEMMLAGSLDVDDRNPFIQDLTSAIRYITRDNKLTPSDAVYMAGDELDLHPGNLGMISRGGRDMLAIIDLGQYRSPESAKVATVKNASRRSRR